MAIVLLLVSTDRVQYLVSVMLLLVVKILLVNLLEAYLYLGVLVFLKELVVLQVW